MAMTAEKASRKKVEREWTNEEVDRVVTGGEWPVEPTGKKKVKKGKGKRHDQRGKSHPDVRDKAEAVIEKVKNDVSADHALGKRVKELRDTGMAWWQIAYQLELPGSGPNVASGKTGAARARTLYKKTFGELPGDVARRSTKASRAAAAKGGEAVRKPVFSDELLHPTFETEYALMQADGEIIERVIGKEIRWVGRTACSDGTVLEVEREARVHPDSPRIERTEGKPTVLHFRQYEKGDRHHQQQWRSVRLADIYDIRR